MPRARAEQAPAKVNLSLRVLSRRTDGYHDIESLVVFAGVADTLTFTPGRKLSLSVRGPTAAAAGEIADNLVLKVARALAERVDGLKVGRFVLSKQLPVAAGVGGGSSDAAAALRLLARANRISLTDDRLLQAARLGGADVPVCLDPRPRLMRGIGDVLSPPLPLPSLPAVLVNPGIAVATKDVFAALGLAKGSKTSDPTIDVSSIPCRRDDLLAFLQAHPNDLERPALSLHPGIGKALAALRALSGCRVARMSGSGATCFGLFETVRSAEAGARRLRHGHSDWWIRATALR